MLQVLDTIVIILFVLFMIYIFRGYHLSKRAQDEKEFPDITSFADSVSGGSDNSSLGEADGKSNT